MKIIISHDVDHLYWNDHLTDLFYPKLWMRETLAFLGRKITAREWWKRMCIPFHRDLHHLGEVMRLDKENGIPSTFFFGMANGLGMSYNRKRACSAIQMVQKEGFKTGVHGIAYEDKDAIQAEFDAYRELTGSAPQGIRMHYVRYTDKTFRMLDATGYAFDTTEFDKKAGCCVKAPYRVERMWEFPLCIMDVYLPYSIAQAQAKTIEALSLAESQHIGHFSVLLHDTNFSNAYSVYRDWYKWFVIECKRRGYSFVDYEHALAELDLCLTGGCYL